MKFFLLVTLIFIGLIFSKENNIKLNIELSNIKEHNESKLKLVENIKVQNIEKIDGYYLMAFNIAMNDFINIKTLKKEEKLLKNYILWFSMDNKNYIVQFIKKGNLTFGKGVEYKINKKTLTIEERLFGK